MARLRSIAARHPRHLALLCLICGLLLSGEETWAGVGGAIAVLAVGLNGGKPPLALVAGALVLAGAWVGAARIEAIDSSTLGTELGHAVTVRGYLVRRERPTRSAHRARVRLTALLETWGDTTYRGGRLAPPGPRWRKLDELVQLRVVRRMRFPPVGIGEEVELQGVLEEPLDRPGDDFDYAAYLRRAGVHGVLRAETIRSTGRSRRGLTGLVDSLRRRAEAGVGAGLEPRLASLARGIVLGQDERIPSSMADDFKDSGLAHLLAVSGQNVTLLAILALPLLAALGLGRRARLAAVLMLIALYVPLTGAGPSVLRAGAMGAAATIGALAGRPSSRWYSLELAAAFTLVLDPRAWLDPGWQLSFAAVVGIFCLAPWLRTPLRKLPGALAEGAALTLAATLATTPLTAFHFERVSAVSLMANLVALPAVAPLMWLGMLAAGLSQLSLQAAALLNALNGYCLSYLAAIARWSAGLPNAVLSVQLGSVWGLAVAYAAGAGALLAGRWIADAQRSRGVRRRAHVALAGASLVVLGGAGLVLERPASGPPDRFTVSFLDVGQGDATLLQAPGGTAVLIDGGPAGAGLVDKLREAGARSLDLVVLTHPQADHEDGLEAVARELPIDVLLDGGDGAQIATHRRIVVLARKRGIRVIAGRAGQAIRVGPILVRVLSPEGGFAAHKGGAVNDRALVLLASYGRLDVLLPADAESNVTGSLPLRTIEILKVAHHGSEDQGLRDLLDRLEPQMAVIEVGEHNRYGHPAADTLEALRSRVSRVYRTDRDGDVRVSLTPEGPVVSTEHPHSTEHPQSTSTRTRSPYKS
jgi:competence protein ComEC